MDADARTGGGLNMHKLTYKQYNEYKRMLRDRDAGRLLTPDGLRLICSSNEYDPVNICLRFLTVLANWNRVEETETMSKSFDFCIKRASNPDVSNFADRDWSKAISVNVKNYFRRLIATHNLGQARLTGKNGERITVAVKITYDPEAEFSYFTSCSCIHDGTFLFEIQTLESCMMNVISGITYDLRLDWPPEDGDTLRYTVGDAVMLNEYDDDGSKFTPQGKPFMKSRTTVLLPISMRIEKTDKQVVN